jgi:ABC-type multidrug transport system ATPase subunit
VRPEEVDLPVRRRVALARAILLDPELLVLDDPLDDLEEDVAQDIVAALEAWARERPRGVLVTSHLARTAAALRAPALPLPVTRA